MGKLARCNDGVAENDRIGAVVNFCVRIGRQTHIGMVDGQTADQMCAGRKTAAAYAGGIDMQFCRVFAQIPHRAGNIPQRLRFKGL